jgi:hypothetical protein
MHIDTKFQSKEIPHNDGGICPKPCGFFLADNAKFPTYVYAEEGVYTVSLGVNESDGNSDTMTKADYISVTEVSQIEYIWLEAEQCNRSNTNAYLYTKWHLHCYIDSDR